MLSLIIFILILGVIVTVHEFGHFIFAKLSNTYVYEFSIGMGKNYLVKNAKTVKPNFALEQYLLVAM